MFLISLLSVRPRRGKQQKMQNGDRSVGFPAEDGLLRAFSQTSFLEMPYIIF